MSYREAVNRIYVGNLPPNISQRDLHEAFERYGRLSQVTIKRGSAPGSQPFAFIEYEDPQHAEDALRDKDGSEMDGCRLRVEIPFNCRPHGAGGGRMTKGRGVAPRRGKYVLEITGLPPTGSWQDLKDHFREVGECMHADVFHDGTGEVSFALRRELDLAIDRLDGALFRSHEGEKSRLHLKEKIEPRGHHRDRSSDPRDRDRSSSRDRYRDRNRDRERDRYRERRGSERRDRDRRCRDSNSRGRYERRNETRDCERPPSRDRHRGSYKGKPRSNSSLDSRGPPLNHDKHPSPPPHTRSRSVDRS